MRMLSASSTTQKLYGLCCTTFSADLIVAETRGRQRDREREREKERERETKRERQRVRERQRESEKEESSRVIICARQVTNKNNFNFYFI